MKTYTPMPWIVESDGTSIAMGDQVVIVSPAPDTASREEMKANARLIAAAPDLLTALQTMVIGQEMGHFSADAYAVARAAIAKARGES